MIWLAMILVILQRVFNWCFDALWLKYQELRLRSLQVGFQQSVTTSGDQGDNCSTVHVDKTRKYYAVHRGFKPGVYYSWVDCEREVKGFSNAEFRSFRYRNDADNYLRKV